MARILVVDDEDEIRANLRKILNRKGCYTREAPNGLEALEALSRQPVEVVLLDIRMPEMDGVRFLRVFKERQPDAARIILSACQGKDELIGAINEAQIYRFLSKPCDVMELVMTIVQAIAHRRLLLEREQLAEKVAAQAAEIDRLRAEVERLKAGG